MIKNNKKKRNKLFITIIECSLFLLIIYLFVSNLLVNNIFKGGNNNSEILTQNDEPDNPDFNRKLFRKPYTGDKRRCFLYISPKDKNNLVKVAAPPAILKWNDFDISEKFEKKQNIDDDFEWLELIKDTPKFNA